MWVKGFLKAGFICCSLLLAGCKVGELLNPAPTYPVAQRFVSRPKLVIPPESEMAFLPLPQPAIATNLNFRQFASKRQLLAAPAFILEARVVEVSNLEPPFIEIKSDFNANKAQDIAINSQVIPVPTLQRSGPEVIFPVLASAALRLAIVN